ncbi:MAG: hypothetical protein JJU06_05830 [Ectothiorhodospiraceae bacterium]|nr:hypothetical protein [Ectothiorhodospiraceae bacterium]MCH8502905.1 hypothetical protein [Ectothiorhodospiraceae bacterium]
MIFTVKCDYRAMHRQFEADNKHDSVKLGIPDDKVLNWRAAGWVDIEGMEPGPEAQPGAVQVQPRDVEAGTAAVKRGKS